MIASTVLLDVDTALGARLGSHFLDRLFRLLLLGELDLVAASRTMPRPGASQAHLLLAVWALNRLTLAWLARLSTAVFDGEVAAALGVQAGDVVLVGSDVIVEKGFLPAVGPVSTLRITLGWYLLLGLRLEDH